VKRTVKIGITSTILCLVVLLFSLTAFASTVTQSNSGSQTVLHGVPDYGWCAVAANWTISQDITSVSGYTLNYGHRVLSIYTTSSWPSNVMADTGATFWISHFYLYSGSSQIVQCPSAATSAGNVIHSSNVWKYYYVQNKDNEYFSPGEVNKLLVNYSVSFDGEEYPSSQQAYVTF
jgi:hypothetical protein